MTVNNSHSDALVFFGATGDLAYKKIFPALQAMVKRGHLNVPVVGVAKAGWNLEQLKARAHDSLEKHGGVDAGCFREAFQFAPLRGWRLRGCRNFQGAGQGTEDSADGRRTTLPFLPQCSKPCSNNSRIAAARPTPASSLRSRSVMIWNRRDI